MTPEQIDRVFGRGRLKMVTGEHVEVFREAVGPGERRRYTKRFLNSTGGDFAHWTEREWRILARLIGHGIACVPDVVQFDRGSVAGMQHVQTYDAGVTVDQWATLLPLHRDGQLFRHAFEDCAHWWALAHHCLAALKEIHQLQLVHLDIKGDNVCIPVGPVNFDPDTPEMTLFPVFGQLALIDFAFSLVSRESLTAPLPIGWQREYDYQSPRLLKALEDGHDGDLRATRELDWRCDIYSLAAMLKRYLPDEEAVHQPERATGWTNGRYEAAKALILTLREHHDRDAPQVHPHQALIDATGDRLEEHDLARSLAAGWTFARGFNVAPAGGTPLTPLTRLAVPLRVFVSPRSHAPMPASSPFVGPRESAAPPMVTKQTVVLPPPGGRKRGRYAALAGAMMLALGAVVAHETFPDGTRALLDGARTRLDGLRPLVESALSSPDTGKEVGQPAAPETTTAQGRAAPPLAAAASAPEPAAATTAAADSPSGAATTAASAPSGATTAALDPSPGVTTPATDERSALAPAPAPQASPKAAAPAREAARAPGKRITARPAPPSRARSPTSVAAAKSPPPSRVAAQSTRGLPATAGEPSSPRSDVPPERTPPALPSSAPTQVAAIAPPPGQAAPPQMAPQPQPPEPVPSSPPVALPGSQLSPAPEAHAPAAPVAPPPARRARPPAKSENLNAEPGLLSLLLGLAKRTPAPIEDRSSPAATVPGKIATVPGKAAAAPQTPVPPADRVASAVPKADAPPPDRVASAVPKADAPPTGWVPFAGYESPAQARAQTSQSSLLPPARDEPRLSPAEESRAAVRSAPAPAPRMPLQASPMPPAPPQSPRSDGARDSDFALQARRTLAQGVPRVAVQAQNEVARVLWAAANALDPGQEQAVVDMAQAVRVRESALGLSQVVEPAAARRFNDEALDAYWTRRNVAEAYDLQLKAFGANPNDPEIAGNLAAYHLKVSPSQPETARQLALHAIAVRGARYRAGRLEDWNTYAVASALTGRDGDARNALYVALAVARNVDRSCRDAASAIATYGERMREPVDAMLNRIRIQGRAYDSPHCAWPLRRAASARIY